MEQVNYSDWIFIIDTAWGDRWHIYRRLTELKIACRCSTGKPLTVTVDTPTAAIQVWSVTRTQSIGRSQLVDWLDRCFTVQAAGIASRYETLLLKQTQSERVGNACALRLRNENRHDSELLDN